VVAVVSPVAVAAAVAGVDARMKFDVDEAIEILERTPAAVRALISGLGDHWTTVNEGPETFSVFDVVGHLVDGEETDWIPRAMIVIEKGDQGTFEPYDRFRHYRRNKGRSLASLIDEFESLRAQNIERLRAWNIDESKLALRANHPALGPVTLSQLLAAWVVHDLGHIAQISRVMAKQYRDEIGAWIDYLPVVTDHERPRS
jgi:hypothetical protein